MGRIRFLKIQGSWTEDPTTVSNHITAYFSNLFCRVVISAILYNYSPLILVILKVIFCILVKLGIVCVLYCPSAEISTRNNKGRILDKFWKKRELQ